MVWHLKNRHLVSALWCVIAFYQILPQFPEILLLNDYKHLLLPKQHLKLFPDPSTKHYLCPSKVYPFRMISISVIYHSTTRVSASMCCLCASTGSWNMLCRKVRRRRLWRCFNIGPAITVTTCNFGRVIIPAGSSHHCLLCIFGSSQSLVFSYSTSHRSPVNLNSKILWQSFSSLATSNHTCAVTVTSFVNQKLISVLQSYQHCSIIVGNRSFWKLSLRVYSNWRSSM